MENIKDLKKEQMYQSTDTNRKVSMFAYYKMTELADSKSQKYGLDVRKVNPAFTSQIAKFKYMRKFGLSIHECAAYTIARRAMGMNEPVPEEMIGVLAQNTKETILAKEEFAREWSYWSALRKGFKDVPVRAFYRNVEYSKYENEIVKLKKHLIELVKQPA